MSEPQTYLVILNWNNASDTIDCLESLSKIRKSNYHFLVVDNGSTDDSIRRISARYPELTLIKNGSNLGYAGGNNVGIRFALTHGAELIGILNNDIVVSGDSIDKLIKEILKDSGIGIVTPLIGEYENREIVWSLGAKIDWRSGNVHRLYEGQDVSSLVNMGPFSVDSAVGSAMLARREVFDNVGLLDEDFFLYYEEIDWCLRVKNSNYSTLAVPSSVVWHKVSSSLGVASPIIDYYMLRNQLIFVYKHWSSPSKWYTLALVTIRNLAAILAFSVHTHQGKRIANRNARLLAFRDFIRNRRGPMTNSVSRIIAQKPGRIG